MKQGGAERARLARGARGPRMQALAEPPAGQPAACQAR